MRSHAGRFFSPLVTAIEQNDEGTAELACGLSIELPTAGLCQSIFVI